MDKTTSSNTTDWPAHEYSYGDYDPVYERVKTALERWCQGMEQVLQERAARQSR
jgi:predicted transcriptional regulator